MSRARVYVVAVLISSGCKSKSIKILNELENHAKITCYSINGIEVQQVNVNTLTPKIDRECALEFAIDHGDVSNVRDVLKSGAEVNGSTTNMKTPLHYAIDKGKLEMVQILIQAGADINRKDKYDGYTPLFRAVLKGKQDLVECLVGSGADVKCNSSCSTRFAKREYTDLCPLHVAVEMGRLDLVQYLVESGAYVNCSDCHGNSPLHYAILQRGNMDIVQYLVQSGADVNCSNLQKHTPLHYAAKIGDLDVVSYIFENGADMNCITGHFKRTPLHLAAESGELKVVQYLIESGADVNCSTLDLKETPLHYAALYGHLDVVQYLIESERGVDINCKTVNGTTPIQIAAQNKKSKVVRYLFEYGADIRCSNRDFLDTIWQYLVDSGIDENQINSRMRTSAYLAAKSENVQDNSTSDKVTSLLSAAKDG